jgi:hypothetical protein
MNYGRIFIRAVRGEALPIFHDRPLFKFLRSAATVAVCIYGFIKFYQEVILRMLE